MTEVRNKENDNANDLLIEQSAFAFDDVLDELLEPDRVVQAEYFLEACSTEEARIINNANVVDGNNHELIDNNEEDAEYNNEMKQLELKISDVFEETEAILTNERKKNDNKDENQEEMAVDNDKEDGNSENSSDVVDEDSDDKKEDDKDEEDEDEEYVVEKILDKRYNRRKKRIEYLIKWAGYDNENENTWESAENCKSAPEAIREYEESLKKGAKKYLLRSRPVTEESGPSGDEEELPKSLKRKTNEIKKELYSEESGGDDGEEVKSKRTKVDCILGVKKEDNEILAVVRFEDGHHDLISTRILVNKCPKKLVNYYEKSLKFVS